MNGTTGLISILWIRDNIVPALFAGTVSPADRSIAAQRVCPQVEWLSNEHCGALIDVAAAIPAPGMRTEALHQLNMRAAVLDADHGAKVSNLLAAEADRG